jgi:hypothetical protein
MKIYQLIIIAAVMFLITACSAQQTEKANNAPVNNVNLPDNKAAVSPTATELPKSETKITDPKTPSETVKALSEAVRTKDYDTARKLFSKKDLAELEKNSSIEKFVDFSNKMYKGEPKTRNEKINGDKATLEVENLGEKAEKWETMNFVKEDGIWKITQDGA